MKTILGVKGWDLSEYAISANAILGIRDSGKTYTGTEAAEELFEAGVPFIAFDPIGVWHSLRIPGKGKGYPVVVAGGKHGDLPLTRKNAGAIVRAAMSAEVSLVLDLFSIELSKADWKSIVRECVEILLHENSEHGLRHIFIEEAAEFVPQRVIDGQVFAAVEKLVRMGGNSKLGCTLINQRSADLNKSVLELCANVFVHRQTGKNTMLDLRKWFEQLALDKAEQAAIADTLPNLKSGECWAFINDLKKPIRLKVPEKNSLHPDRRAVIAKGQEKRKPVPADAFVAQMTAKLAEKDKPAKPIGRIESGQLRPGDPTKSNASQMAAARAEGREEGYLVGHHVGAGLYRVILKNVLACFDDAAVQSKQVFRERLGVGEGVCHAQEFTQEQAGFVGIGGDAILAKLKRQKITPKAIGTVAQSAYKAAQEHRTEGMAAAVANIAAAHLPAPQRKVLASIGFWHSVGTDAPTRAQVGGVAGYSPSSGGFNNLLGALNTAGLITIPAPGRIALAADAPFDQLSADEAREKVFSVLTNPQRKLVDALVARDGEPMLRDDLGAASGYSSSSGGFNNLIGSLCSLTIFEKPSPGSVGLSSWAKEVLC